MWLSRFTNGDVLSSIIKMVYMTYCRFSIFFNAGILDYPMAVPDTDCLLFSRSINGVCYSLSMVLQIHEFRFARFIN